NLGQLLDRSGGIEWSVVHDGQDEIAARLQGRSAEIFIEVGDRDLVDALGRRHARLAVLDRRARERLQLQGDMFENVGEIGAAFETFVEAAASAFGTAMFDERGKPALEAVVETGDFGRGEVLALL